MLIIASYLGGDIMKKFIILLILIALCFTILSGCGNKTTENEQAATPTPMPVVSEGVDATDITNLLPEEIFVFDAASNTITGFQADIVGVTEIVIPEKINGTAVLSIGTNAFIGQGLTSVTFPAGLQSIGISAFKDNKLTEVDIPDSVTELALGVFWKNLLTEITIPDGIESIEICAFRDNKLTSISFPDSVTTIERGAFQNNMLVDLVLPPNLKLIESFAFQENKLVNLVLNDGLEKIDGYAFEANNLVELTIPASVILIGEATEGTTPKRNYEKFVFSRNQLTKVNILGDNTEILAFLMGERNYLRDSYTEGGAGTYTGTQAGPWEKVSGN